MINPMGLGPSPLFVPADRLDRFSRALASESSMVILDLEDAVLPDQKDDARAAVFDQIPSITQPFALRINSVGTRWFYDDIRLINELTAITYLVIPKFESAEESAVVSELLKRPVSIIGLVETVKATFELTRLAQMPGLVQFAFGTADFQVDAGIDGDGEELDVVRSTLVLTSRYMGLAQPLDGVHMDLRDDEQLAISARKSRRQGFGGRLCVHPRQCSVVNNVFCPTTEEIEWSRRVLDALENSTGVTTLDGRLVDKPVADKARKIAALSM